MQISMLALLGSLTGEARGSVGTALQQPAYPRNDKARSLCWSGMCQRGRPIGMRVRCCNVIPAAGWFPLRLPQPAGNILNIRMMYASSTPCLTSYLSASSASSAGAFHA